MNADHDATMLAAAKAGAPVTVTERPGYTYPANLTYWHATGRHKGRARIVLTNGTSRTVKHHTVLLDSSDLGAPPCPTPTPPDRSHRSSESCYAS